jgi:hypothetical protein
MGRQKAQITPATGGTTSEVQNLLSTRLMIKIKRAAKLPGTLTVLAIVRDGAWHELEDNSCRRG